MRKSLRAPRKEGKSKSKNSKEGADDMDKRIRRKHRRGGDPGARRHSGEGRVHQKKETEGASHRGRYRERRHRRHRDDDYSDGEDSYDEEGYEEEMERRHGRGRQRFRGPAAGEYDEIIKQSVPDGPADGQAVAPPSLVEGAQNEAAEATRDIVQAAVNAGANTAVSGVLDTAGVPMAAQAQVSAGVVKNEPMAASEEQKILDAANAKADVDLEDVMDMVEEASPEEGEGRNFAGQKNTDYGAALQLLYRQLSVRMVERIKTFFQSLYKKANTDERYLELLISIQFWNQEQINNVSKGFIKYYPDVLRYFQFAYAANCLVMSAVVLKETDSDDCVIETPKFTAFAHKCFTQTASVLYTAGAVFDPKLSASEKLAVDKAVRDVISNAIESAVCLMVPLDNISPPIDDDEKQVKDMVGTFGKDGEYDSDEDMDKLVDDISFAKTKADSAGDASGLEATAEGLDTGKKKKKRGDSDDMSFDSSEFDDLSDDDSDLPSPPPRRRGRDSRREEFDEEDEYSSESSFDDEEDYSDEY